MQKKQWEIAYVSIHKQNEYSLNMASTLTIKNNHGIIH